MAEKVEVIKANNAFKIHQKVVKLVGNINLNFIELGKNLKIIKDDCLYKQLDYPTFEAYLAQSELSFKRSKAFCLIAIVDYVLPVLSTRVDKRRLEWSKTKEILPFRKNPDFEKWINKSIDLSRSDLKAEIKEHKLKELTDGLPTPKSKWIRFGDFQDICKEFPDNSIDHIITDPPYNKKALDICWAPLSKIAARILKPSGFCVCYSGLYHLPEVYSRMCVNLEYYWQFIIKHTGGYQFIRPRNLNTAYKPLLVFVKPPIVSVEPAVTDYIEGTGKEKTLHEWAQAEEEAAEIIRRFTKIENLILDPFAGSGTIAVAAKKMNRKCISIDNKEENIKIIGKRIEGG